MTSDKILARRAAQDPEAFGELFDRYALKIYRYTYSRVRHHESAEDITSQVFHDAFENIRQYRPMAPFAAWLFTIARRRIADHYRASRPVTELSEELPQDRPEILDQLSTHEEHQRLADQLEKLDEDERGLLRLRYAAEMPYKDIAALVNKKPGAVKIAIYRLLDRLKANMEKTDASK